MTNVGYLSVITMAYQVRNLDHFLKFQLTGFQLSEINCILGGGVSKSGWQRVGISFNSL